MCCTTAAMVAALIVSRAQGASVGDVFVIPLENHNFTQPTSYNSTILPIKGNPAAPFINSLISPGNANAADVSYATNYTNSGTGVHPSEPNYIWSEAGTNYNAATNATITSDTDPSAASKNIFSTTPHLTGLMNTAGVSWKNYQEDYQISGRGATSSASGTLPGGARNPYNNSTLYSYGAKHDPMAFFTDTASQNLNPIAQLSTDLTNNTVGKYNWITPNLYNDMHSALSGGFTYNGTHYTGDQAGVAQGDNFLAIIVPQIEASAAFQNNGAIIIWNDETEGGDTTASTCTEIVISPLAKGNAYASSVPLNHSSDIKTMQEIFGLGPTFLANSIPTNEYSPAGGPGTYNTVAASNDLTDLFQAGAIPTGLPQPSPAIWQGGTGNWSTAAGWSTGIVPNGVSVDVLIDNGNAAASVVTLDQNATVATVTLDAGDTFSINSAKILTLNGPTTSMLAGTLNNSGTLAAASISNSGTFTSTGTLVVSGNFTNTGTATFAGNQTWSSGATLTNSSGAATFQTDAGSSTSSPLSISINGGSVLFSSSQHLAALSVTSGGSAIVSQSATRSVLVVGALTLAGSTDAWNGQVDLTNNDLIVHNGNVANIANQIKQSYNAGNWAGTAGIGSSSAAASTAPKTALGYELNDNGSGGTLLSNFDGQSVSNTDVLVKYTLVGDTNLDGSVNFDDLLTVAQNYGGTSTTWQSGDFTYDNKTDFSDLLGLAQNYNNSLALTTSQMAQLDAVGGAQFAASFAQAQTQASVPEPLGLCCAILSGAALLRRRRLA